MGLVINRAKASAATTGTGSVTPGAAVSPFQTWANAGAVAGYSYDYLIEDGTDWEIGVGVYNGTTVTRPGPGVDPQFQSSTAALLNLTGSETVACVANANTVMAGGQFMPPLSGDFTAATSDGGAAPTLTDDPAVGLVLSRITPNGGSDCYNYAYKALPATGDWLVIARVGLSTPEEIYQGGGIVLIESATSKTAGDIEFYNGTAFLHSIRIGTLTTYGSDAPQRPSPINIRWIKIEHDGTANTTTFSTSADGKFWTVFSTIADGAAFTSKADRIALCNFNSGGWNAAFINNISCPYWHQDF